MKEYYSVLGYAIARSIDLTRSQRALHNAYLTEICKDQEIELVKITAEHGRIVNSYPIEILDEYFAA